MGYGIMAYSFKMKNLEDKFCLQKEIQNDSDGTTATNKNVLDVEKINQLIEHLRPSCRNREQVDALRSYFEGTVSIDDDGSSLWYGLEKYIDNYGVFLVNDQWYPSSNPPFWKMNTPKMFSLRVTDDNNETVRFPSPDDFPTVWIIRSDDFEAAKAEIEQVESLPIEMKDEFLTWIKCCYANQTDLVLYYY